MLVERRTLRGMIAGAVAAAVYFGSAEIIAGAFRAAGAPLLILGQMIIPVVPTSVIKAAIAVFGTHDKVALVITILVVGVMIGGLIGRRSIERQLLAMVLLAGLGLLPVVLLLGSGGRPADALPAVCGIVLGIGTYLGLIRLGHVTTDSRGAPTHAGGDETRPRPDRRAFVALAGLGAGLGIAGVALGRSAAVLARSTSATLTTLVLPAPATSAPAIPAGAQLQVPGLAPLITGTDDFYRIDTLLVPPVIDASTWSLRIHGMVENEVRITMAELLELPIEEHHLSLTCVSNPVGGDLIGTAKWLGLPVRELLARARPMPGADMVLSHSDDGFSASTPLEVLTDERAALVAVGMNDAPLPREHGFPARLVVPGLYGFVSATKWVTELEVTRFADQQAYWTRRGWSSHGTVLVASRVDVPRAGARVRAGDGGRVVTAGMAWAQHTGIAEVQVRLDNGDWQSAQLGEELNIDTWRQWRHEFDGVEPGTHTVTVRATDAQGTVQISERRPAIPGSATGLHDRRFSVE